MVEPKGFEPSTSSMPSRRAPNCATAPPNEQSLTYPPAEDARPAGPTIRLNAPWSRPTDATPAALYKSY